MKPNQVKNSSSYSTALMRSVTVGILLFTQVSFGYRVSQVEHGSLRPWGVTNTNTEAPRTQKNDQILTGPNVFIEAPSTATSQKSQKEKLETLVESSIPSSASNDVDSPPRIIIMGGPASGKGTQCERIASKYGVVHLSTGDMLREAVRQDSENGVGAIAKSYMDAGQLVPDEIMIQIVTERILQSDCQEKGWLLDGFPRTPAQAESLSKMGITPDAFIFLNVPDSELIGRVVGRRLDPVTGKIYHLKYFPPPKDIEGRLTQRSDDNREKMTQRLRQFHANVDAVRSYYEDVLLEIDGTGKPDSIAEHIIKGIASRGRQCIATE